MGARRRPALFLFLFGHILWPADKGNHIIWEIRHRFLECFSSFLQLLVRFGPHLKQGRCYFLVLLQMPCEDGSIVLFWGGGRKNTIHISIYYSRLKDPDCVFQVILMAARSSFIDWRLFGVERGESTRTRHQVRLAIDALSMDATDEVFWGLRNDPMRWRIWCVAEESPKPNHI